MSTKFWSLRVLAATVAVSVLAAACGGGSRDGSDEPDESREREVLLEPASSTGPAPFTDSVAGTTESVESTPADGAIQPANAPGLYGGTGDQSACDQELLVEFLDENRDKANAWADAAGIEAGEVGEYIDTLTPAVLQYDTQVTNHGFADGGATPRQSVLEAGTAVLIDHAGVPRTRCACGNPLVEPAPVDDPVYEGDAWAGWEPPPVSIVSPAPGSEPVPGVLPVPIDPVGPAGPDFCTVMANGRPTVEGGPSGPGDLLPYITRLEVYFADLIAAAEATPGFPEDALTDMQTYHADLVAVIDAGDPSAIEGSTELRDEIEAFLDEYCADPPEPALEQDPIADPLPDEPIVRAQCGSFMFWLLGEVAAGVGLDWLSVAGPFIEQMQDLYAGGLPNMLEYEEIGCEGAQALYDYLVENGYEEYLDGSELDPYA